MTSSFLDKKPPKSLVLQGLEDSTAVGKDEVGSSNLPSSSKPIGEKDYLQKKQEFSSLSRPFSSNAKGP